METLIVRGGSEQSSWSQGAKTTQSFDCATIMTTTPKNSIMKESTARAVKSGFSIHQQHQNNKILACTRGIPFEEASRLVLFLNSGRSFHVPKMQRDHQKPSKDDSFYSRPERFNTKERSGTMAIHPSVIARNDSRRCNISLFATRIADHGGWVRLSQTPSHRKEIHVRSYAIRWCFKHVRTCCRIT